MHSLAIDNAGVEAANCSIAAVAIPNDVPVDSEAAPPAASAITAASRAGNKPPIRPSSMTTNGADRQRTAASTSAGLRIGRPTASGTLV